MLAGGDRPPAAPRPDLGRRLGLRRAARRRVSRWRTSPPPSARCSPRASRSRPRQRRAQAPLAPQGRRRAARLSASGTGGSPAPLLLSDVPGDDPAAIASGPFAADPTTYAEALAAVSLGSTSPAAVRPHLEAGARGREARDPEARRAGAGAGRAPVLWRACGPPWPPPLAEARRQGFTRGGRAGRGGRPTPHASWSTAARAPAEPRSRWCSAARPPSPLRGEAGRGGRNGELALAAAGALGDGGRRRGRSVALATDGEDGPPAPPARRGRRHLGGDPAGGIDPERHSRGTTRCTALAAVPDALLRDRPDRHQRRRPGQSICGSSRYYAPRLGSHLGANAHRGSSWKRPRKAST